MKRKDVCLGAIKFCNRGAGKHTRQMQSCPYRRPTSLLMGRFSDGNTRTIKAIPAQESVDGEAELGMCWGWQESGK